MKIFDQNSRGFALLIVHDSNILNYICDSYDERREMVSWIEESNEKEIMETQRKMKKEYVSCDREREKEGEKEREIERKRKVRKRMERKSKRKLSIYSKRYLTTTTRAIYRHAFQHTAWKRTVRKRSFKEKIHTLMYIPGARLNLYNVQDVHPSQK